MVGAIKRTKYPNKKVRWYLAMEILPNKVMICSHAVYKSKLVSKLPHTNHHCVVKKDTNNQLFITHRKNTGKWRKLDPPTPVTQRQ